eukprot:2829014-Prymnesium_polylepis.3
MAGHPAKAPGIILISRAVMIAFMVAAVAGDVAQGVIDDFTPAVLKIERAAAPFVWAVRKEVLRSWTRRPRVPRARSRGPRVPRARGRSDRHARPDRRIDRFIGHEPFAPRGVRGTVARARGE